MLKIILPVSADLLRRFQMSCLFDLTEHGNALCVSAAFVFRIDPLVNDHLGQFNADHAGAECDDIGIVMHLGKLTAPHAYPSPSQEAISVWS